jgi:hypothetical protein
LGDAFTGFIERDAFTPIQRSQSVLDSLTELKLANSVNQSCVGWKLLRHFQENLFRAHDSILYIIPNPPPSTLVEPALSGVEWAIRDSEVVGRFCETPPLKMASDTDALQFIRHPPATP